MGAQTEDRLAQYKKRYKDWEDPNGKKWYMLQEPATIQEDVVNFNYMTQDFWIWICRALLLVFEDLWTNIKLEAKQYCYTVDF